MSIADERLQAPDPLDGLKQLATNPGQNNTLFLVGNASGWTSLLVIWFPVFAALCYGFVVPFTFTQWGENNLLLILAVWLCGWAALAAFTLVAGTGRHVYSLDFDQREIGHLNSGQSTSLALRLRRSTEGDTLTLNQPLRSGWHLTANERTLAELEPEQVEAIPHWQPPTLKAHLEEKAKDGSLLVLFVFINIPLVIMHFVFATGGIFFITQFSMLAAWGAGQILGWLLEWRDYRVLSRL